MTTRTFGEFVEQVAQDARIRKALHLIKIHIGPEPTEVHRDLHQAVQLIVDFARREGYLPK